MDKRILALTAVAVIVVAAVAVYAVAGGSGDESPGREDVPDTPVTPEEPVTPEPPVTPASGDNLIVFFSVSGNTERAAQELQRLIGGDIVRIVPDDPYPTDQTIYDRVQAENNSDARPGITADVGDVSGYGNVFLLYPIWYGEAPKPVLTFLDTYDLEGKILYVSCTSGGSSLGGSLDEVEASTSAEVVAGITISGSGSSSAMATEIENWLERVGLL